MKRLLTGLALSVLLGATPSMAFDPAQLQNLYTTGKCFNCDLTFVDLSGVDLSNADLTGSNLQGANMSGAYLVNTILAGALLINADLTGAYLFGAELRGANLSGANLTGAYDNNTTNMSGVTFCFTTWMDGTVRRDSCPPPG